MVAVLTVFANHLWGWPSGGFVGVDVFFVISGFLITGNLMRTAESTGKVSFRQFYWNRIRRIVPAATVVLALTYLMAVLVFLPFRANEVGLDALYAFVFLANWHFAVQGTDYFNEVAAVSPIQHYWSLSIEEQFYFVWPALIFVISVVVVRKSWNHSHRMRIAAAAMGVVVLLSFGWAVDETISNPTWAYFNTFARVWELGIGALLATGVSLLTRVPVGIRPLLSWFGLAMIGASIFVINDEATGFPAPWAVLPAAGAALVIAAGVGGQPSYQEFLTNKVSAYIGDISYSLYLVHWPVIVIAGSLMDVGPYYYLTVLALSFGLAIASYHLVESPLRHADADKVRQLGRQIRKHQFWPGKSSQYAMVGAMTLLVIGLISYLVRPDTHDQAAVPSTAVATADEAALGTPDAVLPPLTAALNREIINALKVTEWPQLDPTMESVISSPVVADPEIERCGGRVDPDESCTFGSSAAPIRIVLVGDSVGAVYAGPLREIARESAGRLQVHSEAMFGCSFAEDLITFEEESLQDACVARKRHAIASIETIKPDVVIVSNSYTSKQIEGEDRFLSPLEWTESVRRIVDQFKSSTKKVVFLAPPPSSELKISECYGRRSSIPANCVTSVGSQWFSLAEAEGRLAEVMGGTWVDSRPWFCSGRVCPSFVGSTPTKVDAVHMTTAYGTKIHPVMDEAFKLAGVY